MENYEESLVATALRGLAGAVLGALPGMALWIVVGKIGFVASAIGVLIGSGIIFGFSKLTEDRYIPIWLTLVITVGVFAATIILSEKIVWTWELADAFKEYLPTFREEIILAAMAENSELTKADVEGILTNELYNEIIEETFGIKEGSFSECFSNFGTLLENMDMKGKYIGSLVKSCFFGLLGGVGLFAKIGNNNI